MRIKLTEIADTLGVSPATVSLAVNNRPGVNAETRRKILNYIEQKEQEYFAQLNAHNKSSCKGNVMIVNYIKNGVIMERAEHPALKKIQEALSEAEYGYRYRIFYEQTESVHKILKECRELDVKGIYFMAAEMHQADIYPFLELNIPLVTGDNLFYEENIDSFLIDNGEGIQRGVDYLIDKGHNHIAYLAENIDIFNFNERREAFVLEMAKRECGDTRNRIRYLGTTVDEVAEAMNHYLDEGIRATAVILESSVVSLGVSKALLERKMRIPRDISLLGFDALPPVSIPEVELTIIKGTHTNRHLAAVEHLVKHIENKNSEIMKVYYKTTLREGNSVFDKTKYIYH